jgi:hypothetical protein
MARRLYKTTADYLTIAIAPALIMALVASLVFFLLTVFYRGPHLHRLQYVMFLFVFAAVLIARIAMEEGREKAILYSVLLGVAVIFVVSQLSDLPLLLSIGLIALIWWSADRLTWDSTLIDERERDSGEGLLQTVGLDKKHLDKGKPTGRNGKPDADADVEPLGVTSPEEGAPEQKTWWRRAWEYYHKPHAPGVWVVYFSLAALPIFGLGQRFIPGGPESDVRRAAFRYLFIYVASALALLLSTCFLGLRRYLRQRRVEMPDNLAVTWIATGAAMILALLLFCTLLPRPGAEYAVSQVPSPFGSPENRASWLSFGEDGVKDAEKPGRGRDQSPHGEGHSEDGEPSQPGGHAEGEGAHGEPAPGKGDPKQSSGDGGSGGDSSSGESGDNGKQQSSSNGKQKSRAEGDSSSNGESQNKSNAQNQSGSHGEQSSGPSSKEQPSGGDSSAQQNDGEPKSASSNAEQQRGQSQQPVSREQPQASQEQSQAAQPPPPRDAPPSNRPRLDPMRWLGSLFGFLGTMLKLIFYAALIVAGFWVYRKYKDELLAGFRDLFKDLRAFWDRLFGRKAPVAAEAEAAPVSAGPTYRPFAAYPDPFASGKAGRYTPEQLVKYSFEAFEAWAREHGCPRHPEQTPHEFAQAIGAKNATVSRPARALAELYSRLAYASGPLPSSSIDHLKQLWTALRS